MTLNTITCNGIEKSLADWNISNCRREVSSQASDHLTFDIVVPADAADPFPFGSQITFQIQRAPGAVNPASPYNPPSVAQIPGLAQVTSMNV